MPTQTPSQWVELFSTHDAELIRVRMLWRRGGSRYRPLVPLNLALEELEQLDFDQWEELELPETHFEWATVEKEGDDERSHRVAATARELWSLAVAWTSAKGPVCDFQLRGYGPQDEILFEDGRRCNLSGERARYDDDDDRGTSNLGDALRRHLNDERSSWQSIDRVKDSLLTRMTSEREKLFSSLEQSTNAAPALIERIHELFDTAISYQQRTYHEHMTGAGARREFEVRAFAEQERTKRSEMLLSFARQTGQAMFAAVPAVHAMFVEAFGRVSQSMPEFKVAQHALAYLYLTLTVEDVAKYTKVEAQGMSDAHAFLSLLDTMSRRSDEAQVLSELEPVVRLVLTSDGFLAGLSEQQRMAVHFIVGRAALFRFAREKF